jgi:hypothetical protein
MALKKKRLKKRTCPVCDRKFQPGNKRQIYDRNVCAQKLYRFRVARKLERLQELEQRELKESAA